MVYETIQKQKHDFNFPIVNFIFICMHYNISTAPACAMYISQLIWFSRACGFYLYFIATNKEATKPCYARVVNLKSSLCKFHSRHHDFNTHYWIPVSQMTTEMLTITISFPQLWNFLPFRSTWVHSRFLVRFVLLNILFPVKCFVDYWFLFSLFYFGYWFVCPFSTCGFWLSH